MSESANFPTETGRTLESLRQDFDAAWRMISVNDEMTGKDIATFELFILDRIIEILQQQQENANAASAMVQDAARWAGMMRPLA